ncbi:MAG: gliding motility-associated C-terminal domain-containing protein [Bacteroidia bacterium]|nr:gliding motility-associated C-terminal domain-containing protein [Bacteroidia bacterium]
MKHLFTFVAVRRLQAVWTVLLLAGLTYPARTLAQCNIQANVGSVRNVSCPTGSDGSATLDTNPAYAITWNSNPVQTGLSLTNVPAGTYTATIVESPGCSTTVQVTITEPRPILVLTSSAPDTCGAPNGRAVVLINPNGGGAAPFNYLWDAAAGNQTGPIAYNLRGGNYSVVVTDANGCQTGAVVTVGSLSNGVDLSLDLTIPLCVGQANGAAEVNPIGATAPYTYSWLSQATNQVIGTDSVVTGLRAGNYQVTLIANGCTLTRAFTLNNPVPVQANYNIFPASGCRAPNGSAWTFPAGGTPPYTILWSTGSTNDTIFNLKPDQYTLTVTDTNGCQDTKLVVLSSTVGPVFEPEVAQEDNCGLGQGIVRLNVTVGRPPYEVTWFTDPPQPADTIIAYYLRRNDPGNPYGVILMDADSCIGFRAFNMPGRDSLRVITSQTVPDYCNLATGTARVDFAGGTQPYRYEWTTSPVQRGLTATGLIAGAYEVTVRDSLNCDLTALVTVSDEAGFSINVTGTPETCYGLEDGTATANVTGGRPPFRYTWSNGTSGSSVGALPGGTYNVTVTDAADCSVSGFINLEGAPLIEAAFTGTPDTLVPVALSEATFRFTNLSSGGETYTWIFGDGTSSDEANPIHVFQDTGNFFVKLIVRNSASRCADSVTVGPFVVRQDGAIYVPDAFTPNLDGFNDKFIVKGELVENYSLRIFNRWGALVYESNAITDSWDGTLAGGRAAPQGVYIYHLSAVLPGDKNISQTGTVTLFR